MLIQVSLRVALKYPSQHGRPAKLKNVLTVRLLHDICDDNLDLIEQRILSGKSFFDIQTRAREQERREKNITIYPGQTKSKKHGLANEIQAEGVKTELDVAT